MPKAEVVLGVWLFLCPVLLLFLFLHYLMKPTRLSTYRPEIQTLSPPLPRLFFSISPVLSLSVSYYSGDIPRLEANLQYTAH